MVQTNCFYGNGKISKNVTYFIFCMKNCQLEILVVTCLTFCHVVIVYLLNTVASEEIHLQLTKNVISDYVNQAGCRENKTDERENIC